MLKPPGTRHVGEKVGGENVKGNCLVYAVARGTGKYSGLGWEGTSTCRMATANLSVFFE